MPDKDERREWTAEPETEEKTASTVKTAPTVTEPEPPPTDASGEVPPLAGDRLEDDPAKPYYVTDWKGHPNYTCRACDEAGKHFASTRLARTMEHIAERHLPHEIDLGLVAPSGRPLRIRR